MNGLCRHRNGMAFNGTKLRWRMWVFENLFLLRLPHTKNVVFFSANPFKSDFVLELFFFYYFALLLSCACACIGEENLLFETRIECWWIQQCLSQWMFQFSHKVLWNMWFEGYCLLSLHSHSIRVGKKQRAKWWDFCYLYWLIQLHVLLTTYCNNRRTRANDKWIESNRTEKLKWNRTNATMALESNTKQKHFRYVWSTWSAEKKMSSVLNHQMTFNSNIFFLLKLGATWINSIMQMLCQFRMRIQCCAQRKRRTKQASGKTSNKERHMAKC